MILIAMVALGAAEPGAVEHREIGSAVPRGLRLGVSYVQRVPDDLDSTGGLGTGLWAAYEYQVSDRTALGIHFGGRLFSRGDRIGQVGYGLTLRHGFRWGELAQPYLLYGLLVQSTQIQGSSSYTTSHNTMLGAGLEGQNILDGTFIQASYNLSRLRFFDVATQNASFIELTVGYHWRF
ncbi:MAG: hypothetical protein AAF658_07260 [Myxococcota bacterium]